MTRRRERASCRPVAPLSLLLDIYAVIIVVSVIGSWVGSDNPIFRFADQLTEPLLRPIRKVLPPAGGFDLSPMILIVVVQILRVVIR